MNNEITMPSNVIAKDSSDKFEIYGDKLRDFILRIAPQYPQFVFRAASLRSRSDVFYVEDPNTDASIGRVQYYRSWRTGRDSIRLYSKSIQAAQKKYIGSEDIGKVEKAFKKHFRMPEVSTVLGSALDVAGALNGRADANIFSSAHSGIVRYKEAVMGWLAENPAMRDSFVARLPDSEKPVFARLLARYEETVTAKNNIDAMLSDFYCVHEYGEASFVIARYTRKEDGSFDPLTPTSIMSADDIPVDVASRIAIIKMTAEESDRDYELPLSFTERVRDIGVRAGSKSYVIPAVTTEE